MHKTKARSWTAEEYQRLEEMAGIYPIGTIAKKLGRSEESVKNYAQRKGISLKITVDNFSAGQVAKLLKVQSSTVWYWLHTKKLKGRKSIKSNTWRISCNALKKFHENYSHSRIWNNISQEELDWILGK